MKTQLSQFIQVHCVMNSPGHEVKILLIRAAVIASFGPCDDEYVKIGAASFVETHNGTLYVTESSDEIQELLSKIEIGE